MCKMSERRNFYIINQLHFENINPQKFKSWRGGTQRWVVPYSAQFLLNSLFSSNSIFFLLLDFSESWVVDLVIELFCAVWHGG